MLSGEEVDDRGPTPSTMCPDSLPTDQPKTGTKNRTRQSDHASEKLFTFVFAFPTRNLTPELSRVASRPQIGQAVAAECAAAKQRRLERTVRLQCATKGTAALRKQRPRSLTSRRVGERKTIGAKDLAEAWPRGQ